MTASGAGANVAPVKLKLWQVLLVFPVLAWIAWDDYQDFTRLETEGGVLYVSRTTKLLYTLGGKWAVVALPVGLLVVWAWALVVALRFGRRIDRLDPRAADARALDVAPPPPPTTPPVARVVREGTRPPPARAPSVAPVATPAPAPAPVRDDDRPPAGDGPRLLR